MVARGTNFIQIIWMVSFSAWFWRMVWLHNSLLGLSRFIKFFEKSVLLDATISCLNRKRKYTLAAFYCGIDTTATISLRVDGYHDNDDGVGYGLCASKITVIMVMRYFWLKAWL